MSATRRQRPAGPAEKVSLRDLAAVRRERPVSPAASAAAGSTPRPAAVGDLVKLIGAYGLEPGPFPLDRMRALLAAVRAGVERAAPPLPSGGVPAGRRGRTRCSPRRG